MRCIWPSVACMLLLEAIAPNPARAHFLEVIPSADVASEGGSVELAILFTHPFSGGPVMALERPAETGVVTSGGKADLGARLRETSVGGKTAWTLTHQFDRPGAAVFFVRPQPYWEAAEGKYIVQYAKVVVDAFASGEGWDRLVGLPVEIRPLTRPTGLWTGNAFTGIVLRDGKPLPFADIEVEFVNDGSVGAPNDAFVTQALKADANGTFTYVMPRAGWWGFAALSEGETRLAAPDGKPARLEEGGLIWVKATDMAGK